MRPSGVIVGGWEYIIAAYVVTAVVLIGYALNLIQRLRVTRSKDDD